MNKFVIVYYRGQSRKIMAETAEELNINPGDDITERSNEVFIRNIHNMTEYNINIIGEFYEKRKR